MAVQALGQEAGRAGPVRAGCSAVNIGTSRRPGTGAGTGGGPGDRARAGAAGWPGRAARAGRAGNRAATRNYRSGNGQRGAPGRHRPGGPRHRGSSPVIRKLSSADTRQGGASCAVHSRRESILSARNITEGKIMETISNLTCSSWGTSRSRLVRAPCLGA